MIVLFVGWCKMTPYILLAVSWCNTNPLYLGFISRLQALDRDDPEREKEIYITVIAEDNGYPQLSDACTMKITVEDINDNEPMFDRVVSSKTILHLDVLLIIIYDRHTTHSKKFYIGTNSIR